HLDVAVVSGQAWLTLFDVSGQSGETVRTIVEQFAQSLAAAGLAPQPGCLRCGTLDGAQIIHQEGITTRLCAACWQQALAERDARQAHLDRGSRAALFGL